MYSNIECVLKKIKISSTYSYADLGSFETGLLKLDDWNWIVKLHIVHPGYYSSLEDQEELFI